MAETASKTNDVDDSSPRAKELSMRLRPKVASEPRSVSELLPIEIVVHEDGRACAIYVGGDEMRFPSLDALLAHHRLTAEDVDSCR